ncbi:hypothetical protein JBE27_55095, partial [Streptomyces albiflaviniger]|nr:hypothetical protein [Streptomyces albiflaviniger]
VEALRKSLVAEQKKNAKLSKALEARDSKFTILLYVPPESMALTHIWLVSGARQEDVAQAAKGYVPISEVDKKLWEKQAEHESELHDKQEHQKSGVEILEKEHKRQVDQLKKELEMVRANISRKTGNLDDLKKTTDEELRKLKAKVVELECARD